MKILVVYYSRTGVTETVAKEIAKELKADIEAITDNVNRDGAIGYIKCGKEAMSKKVIDINPIKNNPDGYDLVVVGTPIWGWTMASPIKAFLHKYKPKNVAFFCTMGGSAGKTFANMQELSGKPNATVEFLTEEVQKNNYQDKLKDFVKKCTGQ